MSKWNNRKVAPPVQEVPEETTVEGVSESVDSDQGDGMYCTIEMSRGAYRYTVELFDENSSSFKSYGWSLRDDATDFLWRAKYLARKMLREERKKRRMDAEKMVIRG